MRQLCLISSKSDLQATQSHVVTQTSSLLYLTQPVKRFGICHFLLPLTPFRLEVTEKKHNFPAVTKSSLMNLC